MILSRAEIPWAAARDPYQHHRVLWRLFPDEPREPRQGEAEPRHGFLFRVEDNRPGRPARILVQSKRPPSPAAGVTLIASREVQPQPSTGQHLAFLLTANPVKTIKDTQAEQKPGKTSETCRVPLVKEDEQRAWLARKLEGAAQLETVTLLPHQPLFFRRGNRAGKLSTLSFEGVLCVQDPERLLGLLENGIGPAKAFGCGLLLVRRLG
ncbi:type I-E CRISPR-associated protein Cas6/Cse3/CasE [uncultured Thiodictyon sp.]|uniref:type I-E CRISPR-associated protein Cas6/Cse3/CasE n=1 Tax=uncultured Thiodictyon sp. TaxID=1846217 RepID=UPI0025EC025D|nr:type I-E CRISPR-associated protein Cas6/Cse3/CasE [uncultured Thiodictyon sp.]